MSEAPAPIGRRFVDVSSLSTVAFGHHDPLWWGTWLLIAIESTMFALLLSAYFYIRGNYNVWPPTGVVQPPWWLTGATLLALILSGLAIVPAYRGALHGKLRTCRSSMLAGTVLGFVALVLRGIEFTRFGYFWHSHAYGSIVWAFYFMHTLHLAAGVVEDLAFTSLLFIGPVEKKHMLDLRVSALYWWFVGASWLVLWPILFGDAFLLRNSFVA